MHIVGEDSIVRTAVLLTIRPADVIRDYLAGRTVRYVNPVAYLLFAAAVFVVVGRAIGGSTGAADSDRIVVLLIIPFIAAASRALFWRGPYNLAEHLIIVVYLSAHVLVLLAVFYPGLLLMPSRLMSSYATAAAGAVFVFFVWSYSSVFEQRRYVTILASLLSIIVGTAAWLTTVYAILGFLRR